MQETSRIEAAPAGAEEASAAPVATLVTNLLDKIIDNLVADPSREQVTAPIVRSRRRKPDTGRLLLNAQTTVRERSPFSLNLPQEERLDEPTPYGEGRPTLSGFSI